MKIQENLGIFNLEIWVFNFSKIFWGFSIKTSKTMAINLHLRSIISSKNQFFNWKLLKEKVCTKNLPESFNKLFTFLFFFFLLFAANISITRLWIKT